MITFGMKGKSSSQNRKETAKYNRATSFSADLLLRLLSSLRARVTEFKPLDATEVILCRHARLMSYYAWLEVG